MFYLTKNNVASLLAGSLLCGTGGGLTSREHQKIFDDALHMRKKIPVKGISEFHPSDLLASIYGVGDPSAVTALPKDVIQEAMTRYEKRTGYVIRGVLPGELGAEGLAFQAAATLGLPVVDSDLVGGRAAPKIQMDVFSVYDIPITPVLGLTTNKKEMLLAGSFKPEEIEVAMRHFFKQNGGVGILVGYPIQAEQYKKIGAASTISRAMRYGGYIASGDIQTLLAETKGNIVTEGIINAVAVRSMGGFLQGHVNIAGDYRVKIKNENISLYKQRRCLCAAPDLLVLINTERKPIHNADIKKYKHTSVMILCLPATDHWAKPSAKKLWASVW